MDDGKSVRVELSGSGAMRIELTTRASGSTRAADLWAAFDQMTRHGESFLASLIGPRPRQGGPA